jgi:monothiol glutaredoxin
MSLDSATRQRIEEMIASHDVVLFMKGNREAPQCGFSSTVVGILDGLIADYVTADVLSDAAVREGIKEFSQWPTIPQLYVRGEFLGGCDIIQELAASGELAQSLGVDVPPPSELPEITVTPAASEMLLGAARSAPEDAVIHLGIDARFQNKLYLAPRGPNEIIDVVETPKGPGFLIDNPNAPGGRVKRVGVREIKRQLDAGELGEFFDVRAPEERAKASIPGSRLITPEEVERINGLPKDTPLVFHSHHGGRGQAAAEHFAGLGFTNTSNVIGGIDAWSLEVDSEIPRY